MRTLCALGMPTILTIAGTGPASAQNCDPAWDPTLGQPGFNDAVFALEEYDGLLYAGGFFSQNILAHRAHIARWNDSTWQYGLFKDGVYALKEYNKELVASGPFNIVNDGDGAWITAWHLAGFDGNGWDWIGGGADNEVFAIHVHEGDLIIGGDFDEVGCVFSSTCPDLPQGDVPARFIARWDGELWHAIGDPTGELPGGVTSITTFQGQLIAAGRQSSGGPPQGYIMRWNGTSWDNIAGQVNGPVFALHVHDDGTGGGPALYAGGAFTTLAGESAPRIAQWDGTKWTTPGGGISGIVLAFATYNDGSGPGLYAGGQFTAAGGTAASNIARWDGSAWSSLGAGTNATVRALLVFDDGIGEVPALVVAGSFTNAGQLSANRIATWRGCPVQLNPADLNGDGLVNAQDLAILLGSWGVCNDCESCIADINGDCIVSAQDLGILLGSWGQ